MINNPEQQKKQKEKEKALNKIGLRASVIAIRVIVIGGLVSLLLAAIAAKYLFSEPGDSAGPGFFFFGLLAVIVLVISSAVAITLSTIGIKNSAASLEQNAFTNDNAHRALRNNFIVIIFIIFSLIVICLLTNYYL